MIWVEEEEADVVTSTGESLVSTDRVTVHELTVASNDAMPLGASRVQILVT